MTVRIPIVISISNQPDGLTSDFAADLAARLMMEQGCDVSVIGPLERIVESSTDLLLLEGLPRDALFLASEPSEEIQRRLTELGVTGNDATAPKRHFLVWQITHRDPTLTIVRRVAQHLKDRQTQVVSIGGLPKRPLLTPLPKVVPIKDDDGLGSVRQSEQWLDGLVDQLSDLDL